MQIWLVIGHRVPQGVEHRAEQGVGVLATVQGHHLAAGNTGDAVKHGVAIVPQELASIEDMTVYENLFVGRDLRRGPS